MFESSEDAAGYDDGAVPNGHVGRWEGTQNNPKEVELELEKENNVSVRIIHGEPLADHKSTFLVHLARVPTERQVRRLREQRKRVVCVSSP